MFVCHYGKRERLKTMKQKNKKTKKQESKKNCFYVFMFSCFRARKGFTLVELMISISIIGMLTAVFLANYRSGGIRTDLIGNTQKMASDIRVAQNFSLGTKDFNGATPAGGWGIYFDINDPNSYIIFADINGDYTYNVEDEKYSQTTLAPRLAINELRVEDTSVDAIHIIFLPPDPETIINGQSNQKAHISLQEDVNNTTKTIEVNFLGLIDILN